MPIAGQEAGKHADRSCAVLSTLWHSVAGQAGGPARTRTAVLRHEEATRVISDRERQRRFQAGLCGWCANPLPACAGYSREFCDATCRQRNHRELKRNGLR